MLSVRLTPTLESELAHHCQRKGITKSYAVQEALASYLVNAKAAAQPASASEADLSFLAADDPIRAFIGSAKAGPSTDEWMAITRGEDWNQP